MSDSQQAHARLSHSQHAFARKNSRLTGQADIRPIGALFASPLQVLFSHGGIPWHLAQKSPGFRIKQG
jgi:hypothetical protein